MGTFGDQSTSVMDLFLHCRSSQKAHTRLTRFPSESSLNGQTLSNVLRANIHRRMILTLLSLRLRYSREYSHNYRSELVAQS